MHHELVSLTNKMTGSETAGEGRGNFRVNIVRDGRSFPSAYVHIWGQQTERGWSAWWVCPLLHFLSSCQDVKIDSKRLHYQVILANHFWKYLSVEILGNELFTFTEKREYESSESKYWPVAPVVHIV